MWNIATDTGGTFTDLVAVDESGQLKITKTPSTPSGFEHGVMDAIARAAVPPDGVRRLLHATTVATNAILTRSGSPTGIIASAGFRDVIELRDGSRQLLYDVNWDPPAPLVARRSRLEVTERVNFRGEVIVELVESDVRRAAQVFAEQEIRAVAVCLMHSYARPDHERRVMEILREELPHVFVCTSSNVLPEPPEFARTATTVANAYVGAVLDSYLAQLAQAVADNGYRGDILIMHSGGGTMSLETARRVPIRTATSGPAAGVLACAELARVTGRSDAVSLDMGGTSADIGTIYRGQPRHVPEHLIEWGLPVRFPTIDVAVIGAGGGSVAWIDSVGAPHSGPQSAGADPGPACYGKGGVEPTNTDANLTLGCLRPATFLDGRLQLSRELAQRAIADKFAAPLGMTVLEAASAIIRLSNEHMANGIREATVQRGLDPRRFSLFAFGGAGPMHAVEIARELGMPEVIVPRYPGATSALGLLFSDVRHDLVISWIVHQDHADDWKIADGFGRLQMEALDLLGDDGFSPEECRIEWFVDMRYLGQVRVITLPVGDGAGPVVAFSDAVEAFHNSYEAEFGYAVRDLPAELTALRVVATGVTANPDLGTHIAMDFAAPVAGYGEAYFAEARGAVRTAFYTRDSLLPGATFEGPAVVEQYDSTTVVPPGSSVVVDGLSNLVISTGATEHAGPAMVRDGARSRDL